MGDRGWRGKEILGMSWEEKNWRGRCDEEMARTRII